MRKSAFLIALILMFSFLLPCRAQEEKSEYGVKDYLEQALPPQRGRKIVLNEAVGLLTITDTPSHHKLIRRLLDLIDVGPSQISIEARFVELSLKDLHELGVEWGGSYVEPVTAPGGKVKGITGWAQSFFGAGDRMDAGMGLWLGKTYLSGSELWAYLRALKQTGQANMLSSPRLTTLSGQPANIQVIERIPYASDVEYEAIDMPDPNDPTRTIPQWVATYTIEEKIVGINLEVTPSVGKESDIITLDIHPEISEVVENISIYCSVPDKLARPVIDRRSIQTSVIVKNGETVVMGGLIKDEDTKTVKKKVPILGNIPLIGKLFQHQYSNKEKRNLVVFITATLVSAEGEDVL